MLLNSKLQKQVFFQLLLSGLSVFSFAGNPGNFIADKTMPIIFRENAGQWDSEILFGGSSIGWDAHVYFMKDKLSFGFSRPTDTEPTKTIDQELTLETYFTSQEKMEYMVWNMNFKNSNPGSSMSASGQENSHTNYLIGEDFSKHCTNVNDYRAVEYNNIYNNVDVRYYGTGSTLKYDFIVKQGGDVSAIQMQCEGVNGLAVNARGELEIQTPWGKLIEHMPESYQYINGKKKLVDVKYQLLGDNTFGFKVNGSYDKSVDLVIDPVTLAWSTFVGASVTAGNGYLFDIYVDVAGNTYGTGYYGSDFPTTPGVYGPTYLGGGTYVDAFVFKLNPTGTGLVYCTYLGGAQKDDEGWAITADAAGNAFVKGVTGGQFPVTAGSFDVSYNGGLSDMFVCKLNPTGTALSYSTYVGGANQELDVNSYQNDGIVVNAAGEVFTGGRTWSNNFPTTPGCYDNSYNGGFTDGVVFRLNAAGSALIYSTYLGGSNTAHECVTDICINSADEAYVTGFTNSADFPTTAGCFQAAHAGSTETFVTKLNANGTALLYSTFIGGTNYDIGGAIAVNTAGEAYITGATASANYPTTAGAYDITLGGSGDFFVSRFNAAGTGLVFSTYVGGSGGEGGYDIVLNAEGAPLIAGGGIGTDFPATNCAVDETDNGSAEIMVFRLDVNGTRLDYGTYIGGNHKDYTNTTIYAYGPCGREEVWVSCTAHSLDFPTTPGTFQSTKLNGQNDQPVVFKFNPPVVNPGFTFDPDPACNVPIQFTDTMVHCGLWRPVDEWFWDFGDGNTSTLQNPTHTYTTAGLMHVTLRLGCYDDVVAHDVLIGGTAFAAPDIIQDASCEQVLLTSPIAGANYSWNTGETTQSITPHTVGSYWVEVDMGGCSASDTIDVTQTEATSVVFFPNTFTPNKDNINDVFSAFGENVSDFEINIFNRWGEKVFKGSAVSQVWDGTFNGSLSQIGVYAWKAKFKVPCYGDQVIEKSGHVSLLR